MEIIKLFILSKTKILTSKDHSDCPFPTNLLILTTTNHSCLFEGLLVTIKNSRGHKDDNSSSGGSVRVEKAEHIYETLITGEGFIKCFQN